MKAKYLLLVGLMNLILPCAYANPVIDNVAAGKVEVTATDSHLHVHQNTPQAIVNWQSFNIAQHESVHFQQPPQGIALNRIDANQGASQIAGRLSATGNIILSNAAGIHFGSTAQVDVAGLVATTANISDRNFLSGNYAFEDNSGRNGSVTNAGTINASEHGFVALMAPHVANTGRINAHLGQIEHYSTTQFTLNFNGNDLVHFAVDQDTLEKAAKSKTLKRDNGKVAVSAKTAKKVLDNVIKLAPGSEANFVHVRGDTIILSAKDESHGKMYIDPRGNNIIVGAAHTDHPSAVVARSSSLHSGSDSDSDYEMVSPQPLSPVPVGNQADADYHFVSMPVNNNLPADNQEYSAHMSADGTIVINAINHVYPDINHVYYQRLNPIIEEDSVSDSRPASVMSHHSGLSSDSDASHLSQWSSDSEVELISGRISFANINDDSPSRPASPLSNASSYVDLGDVNSEISVSDLARPVSAMSMNDDLPSRPVSPLSDASNYVDLADFHGELSMNDDLPSRPVSAMSNTSSFVDLSSLSSESSYIDVSRPASALSMHDEVPFVASPTASGAPVASRLSGESDFNLLSDLSGESSWSDISRPASVISMYSDQSVASSSELNAEDIAFLNSDFQSHRWSEHPAPRAEAIDDYGIAEMFAMNPPAPPKADLTPVAVNQNVPAAKSNNSQRAIIPAALFVSALTYYISGGHEVGNSPLNVDAFKYEGKGLKQPTMVHPYIATIGDSLLNKFKRMALPKCYTVQPNPMYQYEYTHCSFDDQNFFEQEV